jgi:hypothetical protein
LSSTIGVATPEKFVPQYGGYCALAISLNKIADIEAVTVFCRGKAIACSLIGCGKLGQAGAGLPVVK